MSDPSDSQDEDILAEFQHAVSIERFHRFAITQSPDVEVYFGLLDKDGINHYFKCEPAVLAKIALEFIGLAQHSQFIENGGKLDRFVIPFDTSAAFTKILMGNKTEGHIGFTFLTPSGESLETIIGPGLAAMLAQSLDEALSNLPQPPKLGKGGIPRARVPGQSQPTGETVTYFGQEYPSDILKALGVLTIRANLLEHSLTELFAALSGIEYKKAAAIFFSSINAKARIDMITSLVPVSEIPDFEAKQVKDILDKVNNIFKRRNDLVHGSWKFNKDKFIVEVFKPARKDPIKIIHVSAKDIEELALDYRQTGFIISSLSSSIELKKAK